MLCLICGWRHRNIAFISSLWPIEIATSFQEGEDELFPEAFRDRRSFPQSIWCSDIVPHSGKRAGEICFGKVTLHLDGPRLASWRHNAARTSGASHDEGN